MPTQHCAQIGAEHATSAYLNFLDSGNILHTERLARMVAGPRTHPGRIATFNDRDLIDTACNEIGDITSSKVIS